MHLRVSLPTENVIQMLVFLYLNGLPHEPPFRLTHSESDLILSFLGGHVPAEFLFFFKLHTTPLSCHCRTCVIPLQSVPHTSACLSTTTALFGFPSPPSAPPSLLTLPHDAFKSSSFPYVSQARNIQLGLYLPFKMQL